MTYLSSAISDYSKNSEINFCRNEGNRLLVTIDTERLHIRSVEPTEPEYNRYAALFGDPTVVEKYAAGTTKTKEEMQTKIDTVWGKRWSENDPYSGFAVFSKEKDDFLGHVTLGHDTPGRAELGYIFHKSCWQQGYGSEAVTAVVKDYAPKTVEEGYTLQGLPLEEIIATVRPDNPPSARILQKIGMRLFKEEERYGTLRHHYSVKLKELPQR